MKRKLKQEAKLALILIFIILIIILMVITIITMNFINKDNKSDDDLNNNVIGDIAQEEEDDDIIEVIIDEPKNEENNESNNNPENENVDNTQKIDKNTYYIKVNIKANVVTVYKKDSEGKYTIPLKAMLCSVGTATPKSGVYKTSDMYTWRLLEGNVYGQYAVRITGHILFHSVPYIKQAKNTLEWWEYDKLGTDASLGCVRLAVQDAKWIYDNCAKGTQVEFYSSSDPGPLGKPTAKKISSYSDELKNWDPTDPDSKNPWRTYVETPKVTETEPQVDTEETSTTPVEEPNTDNYENVIDTNTILDNI